MRPLFRLFSAAGLSLAAFTGIAAARTHRALPRYGGEARLWGLDGAVEVRFDRWGVPHIRARSLADAFFAQGYVTAQDRMVQMETLRRASSGCLSEAMGKRALVLDRFMRDLGLHRTAAAAAGALPPDTALFLDRYAAGVNAYLEERRSSLPLELSLTAASRPQAWEPRHSLQVLLLLHWGMEASWTADLMRGRLARRLGREEARRLLPPWGKGDVPALRFPGEEATHEALVPPPECELDFFPAEDGWPDWIAPRVNVSAQGSNNWVLSGEITATGKPILCNDLHLRHGLPTWFHLCHLRAEDPDYHVAGAALPGLPGVLVGRNDRIAWGAARLAADTTDLYVETLEGGAGACRYLHEGEWRDAEVLEEEIRVFPRRRVRHQVVVTAHGPVIARSGNKALALKWAGHDIPNDSAGCLVRMGMAGDWEGFTRSLEGYRGPALGLVYADVDGNIAFHAAGRIPVREGHDGSVPVPGGEGGLEWRGYLGLGDLPSDLNPERGWIATSNSKVVGGGYPHLITTAWGHSHRQERIAEMLSSSREHDIEDMRRMQGDTASGHAGFLRGELLRAARGWEEAGPEAREALALLEGWDGRADASSAAQSICYMAWKVLSERLLRHRLGHALYFDYMTSFPNAGHALEEIVSERDESWLPPSARGYDELLRQCLEEALSRLAARFGTYEMERWQWGRMHALEIRHPLGFAGPLRRILNLGPVPHAGDGESVNCSPPESDPTVQMLARSSLGPAGAAAFGPRFYSDRACAGAVFRMIVDLSGADDSRWCLDAGQCSNPLSPHYRDFFDMWRRLEYAPMAFSEEKVKEVTRSAMLLVPAVEVSGGRRGW